jgi:hypothetical protein
VVDYRALTGAPRETVQAVYNALGLSLSADYDDWLAAQAEREKKHHSKFEYSLGEFHLEREAIRTRLAGFYREYDWDRTAPSAEQEVAHG